MEAISLAGNGALLLSSALCGLWAYKARLAAAPADTALGVWALSCVFVASAMIALTLPAAAGSEFEVVQRMALNLAIYAAVPLMAVVLFAVSRRLFWSAAGWGRLLLGLFALFELTRQLGYGSSYLQLLGAACCLGLLAGAVGLSVTRARASGIAGTLVLGAGGYLLTRTDGADTALFNLLAAVALLLLTTALGNATAQHRDGQGGDAQ